METRKVQTVGNGTYTVSLPKEWADAEGIDAGDTVTLHDHVDGVLTIQARDGSDDRTGTRDRCEDDDPLRASVPASAVDPTSLERTLRAAYAAGATAVTLEHEEPLDPDRRRALERIERSRIGTSVTEESDAGTTVRMLLDSEEVSVRQSLRQLGFVVDSMQRAAIESLSDAEDRTAVTARDEQADRLSAMIDRSVARGLADLEELDALGTTRPDLFESWTAMRELGRVREAATGIDAVAARMDDPPTESRIAEIRELAEEARSVVSDGVSVVVEDEGVDAARRALDAQSRTCESIEEFDRRLAEDDGDTPELRSVLDRVRRTAERGGVLAELGLSRAIRRGDPPTERPDGAIGPTSR
ncbi:AbrB/MazE/SpoVT family DNA-binding domain-containing protein [Halopenitus salinus]|uniref:AbrB/MazE/SpoVT family DNA-binding domain-containing protein n=1 Tax=Halopenitus salinus TaxID=1198295 RepID=A0ABD5UYY6_9EURY